MHGLVLAVYEVTTTAKRDYWNCLSVEETQQIAVSPWGAFSVVVIRERVKYQQQPNLTLRLENCKIVPQVEDLIRVTSIKLYMLHFQVQAG